MNSGYGVAHPLFLCARIGIIAIYSVLNPADGDYRLLQINK